MLEKELDLEWVGLIKEAISVGVTKEEILEYLHRNKKETNILIK
ncbi:anti-repressor SinI family protein [Bacillus salacetis]